MRARLSPTFALRLGAAFAALFLLLALAVVIGFRAGAGSAWACRAVLMLGAVLLLVAVAVVWNIKHSFARSSDDAAKVAERLDRVFQHVNGRDS